MVINLPPEKLLLSGSDHGRCFKGEGLGHECGDVASAIIAMTPVAGSNCEESR
jgi:hypothetical protein